MMDTSIKKIVDIEELHKHAISHNDDMPTLDSIIEQGNNFEFAYRLTTALDSIISGTALEYDNLNTLVEEYRADKDALLDTLEAVFDIDKETLDSLSSEEGDDFTDVLDIVSETILDEFDEDIAPLAVSLFAVDNGVTMDYTFYPTAKACNDGNSGNRPKKKGQSCTITAHRGVAGYKRAGRVKGNPYKKTSQIGKHKQVSNRDGKLKAYIKSMKKMGYMDKNGKHTEAFKRLLGKRGKSTSKSSKKRNKD